MPILFLATGNAHKIAEICGILGPDFTCLSQRDAGVALEISETGRTFAQNAQLKAAAWAAYLCANPGDLSVEWVLADDSGLEVDELQGAPGVHSARFAAIDSGHPGNSSDAANNAKLLRLLAHVPQARRVARFRCVLALAPASCRHAAAGLDAATKFFEGCCEGRIQSQPAGGGGFGYDPLFIPEGQSLSFAELGDDAKNKLSHRARALAKLAAHFRSR